MVAKRNAGAACFLIESERGGGGGLLSGCAVAARHLARGCQVVGVELPQTSVGTVVEADAVVVWSTPGVGMGLQFTTLSDDHQRVLDDFVVTHFFSSRRA